MVTFPLVGEAVTVFRSPASTVAMERRAAERRRSRTELGACSWSSPSNRERANRRRRVQMRRYAVQNLLTRLVTLTFAPNHDGPGHFVAGVFKCTAGAADADGWCVCGRPWGPRGRGAALGAVELWVRRVRRARGGEPFAYLVVAEQHKDGHWHLHVAVHRDVALLVLVDPRWEHGRVDAGKELRRPGLSLRDRARLAASYCAKYAGKEVAGVDPGRQAYRVAQGFKVRVQQVGFFADLAGAVRAARGAIGEELVNLWLSPDEWDGPPCAVMTFGPGADPP